MYLPFLSSLLPPLLGIIAASLQPAIAHAGHPQPHDGCTGLSSSTPKTPKTTRKPARADGVTGWHPRKLDYRTLSTVKTLQPGRLLVVTHSDFCDDVCDGVCGGGKYNTAPVLAKLVDMGSPTDRQSLANEVAMYQRLDGTRITPAFHGHVVDEEGRAIGFLLEYIVFEKHKDAARRQHGRQSLQACMAVLSRLHDEHGVAHGDPHDGNCLVRNDGSAVLIDFELAEENAAPAERARDKRILERCIRSLSGQVTV